MVQFDTIFFAMLTLLIFFMSVLLFFIFFRTQFSSWFKIKMIPKNVAFKKGLVLTIRKDVSIREAARISFIKEKLLKFYEKA